MRVSFRTRQFVYAALVVGVALAAVTAMGWTQVLHYEVDRLDERLCMEARRTAGPLRPDEDAQRLAADMALKLRLDGPGQLMLQATSPDGAVRLQSPNWNLPASPVLDGWAPESTRPEARQRPGGDPRGECELASFPAAGAEWRAARIRAPGGSSLLAADLSAIRSEMQGALTRALGLVVPLTLGLAGASAWLLAHLTMRPVNRLRDAMRALTPQALDRRLPDKGEDREFMELIAAYNTMLERLEASFHQASRFSADAAHELKTPLTILRGQLEQAIKQSHRRSIQDELSGMLDEVGRLSGITRKLLLLSQADAGRLALRREPVDVSTMLGDRVSDAQMMLQGQRLESRIEPGLSVEGDELLLGQMFNNLVGNAVRHGRADGWIRVEAQPAGDGVQVTVANACAPLGAAQREHLFERFFRADAARGRQADGTGLGLSLAREIARAHGGELRLDATADDEIRLRLTLPRR